MENQDEVASNEEQFTPAGQEGKPVDKRKQHFNKPQETKKQSMMDKIRKDMGGVVEWLQQLEGAVGNIQRMNDQRIGAISAAIRVLYDDYYKDCPVVKEADLFVEESFSDYAKVIGYYYLTRDNVVVRLEPIEKGWTVVDKVPSKEMFEHEGNKYPTEDVTFNFEGIALNPTDEVVVTLNCVAGMNPLLKLRDHLFSLKDKKTDIIV